ncbi:MAG: hypothetical protein HYS27_10575 [Deltaproteobacteria bacterium]|nr:hypothetical protein [Deltaproteobacteria bacterium]
MLALALLASACGDPPLHATFTSRILQHETCRVVGDRPEVCTRDERTDDVRVRIVEQADDNVWLYGIPRGGVPDRAILGSLDAEGGWLFVDEVVHESDGSGCTVTDRIEISLEVSPEADQGAIGVDPCVPLLGHETEVTQSSAGCDTVNDPQLAQALIARRRWEQMPECTP